MSVPGLEAPACCALGADGFTELCGVELGDPGAPVCVPRDNPGEPSKDCAARIFEGEPLDGCCRYGAESCGVVFAPVPGSLEFGCIDPVLLGLPRGGSCTTLEVCSSPNPGASCTLASDCCAETPGDEVCVTFSGDFTSSCTEYCETNADCDTGCCVTLTDGRGACALDSRSCSAACRTVDETCDSDLDCCSGSVCAGLYARGPRVCRPACDAATLCGAGTQCLPDEQTGAAACVPDSVVLCSDTCFGAANGACDEATSNDPGGSGICTTGTDCGDCGPRVGRGELCSDGCAFAADGVCDDGGTGAASASCYFGDDCTDCGPRAQICLDTCAYARDGACDETTAICAPGTDCTDCGPSYSGQGQNFCDGTTSLVCTPPYASVSAPDSCLCADCAWNAPQCGVSSACDGATISACCAPGDPCGIGADGLCDCAGWCDWESDCPSSGGTPDPRACDGVSDPVYSSCCDFGDPCGWADDGVCDCGGACPWEPECVAVSPGGSGAR